MESDPASDSGTYVAVRLHILTWPTGVESPSAAWVMELSDVEWRPPEGWRSQINDVLVDPGDGPNQVTVDADEGPQGLVLNIVARTHRGTAQLIGDRHQASTLLGTWAEPRDGSIMGDPHTSDTAARDAVLLVLKSHFGMDADSIDSVAVNFEPGDEIFVHVTGGASQYVGTVTRQGRAQISHVVHQREVDTDKGEMDAG